METAHTNIDKLLDSLFRNEAGRLVAMLTRLFGVDHLDLAEDVVQDSLVEAMKDWPYKGIPENPSGWLYKVARNKALNILNRDKYKRKYFSHLARELMNAEGGQEAFDHFFSEPEIRDDQLRMIFVAFHPALSRDSQVAFTLKAVCRFSIYEISRAFLTTEDTVNKRLVRARQRSGKRTCLLKFRRIRRSKSGLMPCWRPFILYLTKDTALPVVMR